MRNCQCPEVAILKWLVTVPSAETSGWRMDPSVVVLLPLWRCCLLSFLSFWKILKTAINPGASDALPAGFLSGLPLTLAPWEGGKATEMHVGHAKASSTSESGLNMMMTVFLSFPGDQIQTYRCYKSAMVTWLPVPAELTLNSDGPFWGRALTPGS